MSIRSTVVLVVALGLACFITLNITVADNSARSKEDASNSSSPLQGMARLRTRPLLNRRNLSPAPPAKLEGCVSCHGSIEPMHKDPNETEGSGKLKENGTDGRGVSCTGCHGGNPIPQKISDASADIERIKNEAHVQPRFPAEWKRNGRRTGANPENTNTLLARESWEFVRFINPGDLRVAATSCAGSCHQHDQEVKNVPRSMMTHGAMLWGAALYNNGNFPLKDARFGESYNEAGAPQRLIRTPAPTLEEQLRRGYLSFLDPIPRWEVSQPGNVLRVFERGGKRRLEVGNPDKDEDPGRPDKGLSPRGFGTNQRTDPVFLGLQKTRLLDPTLNFLGTNDHPGDYRSSGCSACHVIYANDRDKTHSEFYSAAGNMGLSQTADHKNIPADESGHPIKHQFTNQIPTSQCMVCHMHPGTNMVATYLGMTWWDNESDGDKMYPQEQHDPTQAEEQRKLNHNPESASLRGLWSNLEFLQKTGAPAGTQPTGEATFNSGLKNTQFGDFHGHGWMFRKVYKRDRKGTLLDADDNPVVRLASDKNESDKFGRAVHLNDIHLEKGMHCVDCHFRQDAHGDGNLYNEPRAAIEVGCVDCHGSIKRRAAALIPGAPAATAVAGPFTSGPAAAAASTADAGRRQQSNKLIEAARKTPAFDQLFGAEFTVPMTGFDLKRIRVRGREDTVALFELIKADTERPDEHDNKVSLKKGDIIQHSMVEPKRWWRVKQTMDTVNPGAPHHDDFSEKSRYAKLLRKDNTLSTSGVPEDKLLAHRDDNMTCFACHSSWVTSCFGCHLSMQANRKMPNRHNEGGESRNYTQYNFQVLRDDIFMLGRDGTVTGNRVAPVRSSSAVLVSSQNQNREWIYSQQQTISAEGFAGQTFNTHVPHTVRAKETKQCTDCHVSQKNDNNAWLAQVMLQGTNFVNFMGRYVYVASNDALEAVVATEHTDPQAVYGSSLHRIAYPDNYRQFIDKRGNNRELREVYEHKGNPRVLQVQLRGEYAYVAAGEGGLRVYDVAQIDQKGFSERISTAPVSQFGQKFYVKTKYATAVASPTTLGVDPTRWRMTASGKMISPLDALKLTGKDRDQLINQEQPIHDLYGYLYVVDKFEGLILVGAGTLLDGDPLNNYLSRALNPKRYPNGAFNQDGVLTGANNIQIAGTFAYITTDRALVIVDISTPLEPKVASQIPLRHPCAVAIQFRYGFVVDEEGLKVIDVTLPERAHLIEGATRSLSEAQDVYVARTYAYVACGKQGIAIVDVEHPENPVVDRIYNAEGQLNDVHQVKIAMTNASLFAYVADGKNGLRILQLTSPETMPEYAGFSPRPNPELIATYKTKGEALAISKPLDRDRAVDESGNQVSVFGRRGARPFNLIEMMKMLRTNDGTGDFFQVTDEPPKRISQRE